MIRVTLKRHHIPQQCECIHHADVYIVNEETYNFLCYKALGETLAMFHRQQASGACWIYEVTRIEPGDANGKADFPK